MKISVNQNPYYAVNTSTCLQTCIQIGNCRMSTQLVSGSWRAVNQRHNIEKPGWSEHIHLKHHWDVLLCCNTTDNLDNRMLFGKASLNSWRACCDMGPICDLSAGRLMYRCGLDGRSQGCVLLLSVPWHSGHFNPQSLLTGTPQPATVRYSFAATLVFIISAARPH